MDEIIRLNSCCRQDSCSSCDGDPGLFKCKDCFGGHILCHSCLLSKHSQLPLHRILVSFYLSTCSTCINQWQHWTGSYYRPSTLRELGLIVQLGHHGGSCPIPGDSRSDFTVVHTNGVHNVNIRFCGCSSSYGASHSRVQLLRVSWLPASLDLPRTAFTFDCLDTFHVLNLQSKISTYDYYLSVAHISDNIGTSEQKVCHHHRSRCCY